MAKFVKPLTETQIKNLKPKATPYADGNNLYLFVYPSGAKSFAYIYTHPVTKKRVKKKIGDYPDLVLFDARDIAHKYSRLIAKTNPLVMDMAIKHYIENGSKRNRQIILTERMESYY